MKNLGRWSLAVAVLAISGWAWLRIPPEHAPAAISKPPATADRPPPGSAGDPFTGVHRNDAVRALGLGQTNKKDWPARFHAVGSNYFEFVAEAAQAAYEGDGAAQYYIGHAMARCEETNALYQDADSADQAVSHLAFSPAFRELERQEYLDCRKFRSDSPFRGLPERPGGYPAEYWRSRALESRYPVAVVAAALDSPGQYTPQVVATALATGNADAMLLFGWSQATTAKATESAPIMAAAWVLAACRSGANCGPTNDVLPLATCSAGIELGCTERYTAIDELTATLGPQDQAEANLLAQDIQGSMQYRDPARLMKYLPFMSAADLR
jgi:hypothetical protein